MPHKIFLSHNCNDKPLVEAVAVKLAAIFGQDLVFYDSWSIKPGDGIIDKMNEGLDAPEFVFFFVSKNSLASGMVALEWQNALYSASKGETRIIPVRMDGSEMPAVLKQTLFIDMYTIGLESAIAQIVSVTQGNASFTPQHLGFSNLTYKRVNAGDGSFEIIIQASHLMEPSVSFAFVTENEENEISVTVKNHSMQYGGYKKNAISLANDQIVNVITVKPVGAPLTPSHPVRFEVKRTGSAPLNLIDVLHERGENLWSPVPNCP
ncbi:toll/interleukin-1 receptor domain-containing protein [Sphingomonas flavalba]|uniref:toll/interleukin-1 receptor domain-containing protein n=1 Tax=Sphingomonas flavalba TaxID=2559804 RepID=UPI0039E193F9